MNSRHIADRHLIQRFVYIVLFKRDKKRVWRLQIVFIFFFEGEGACLFVKNCGTCAIQIVRYPRCSVMFSWALLAIENLRCFINSVHQPILANHFEQVSLRNAIGCRYGRSLRAALSSVIMYTQLYMDISCHLSDSCFFTMYFILSSRWLAVIVYNFLPVMKTTWFQW